MNRVLELQNHYKQYGFYRFMIYLITLMLKLIGLKYERYLYMTIPVNYSKQFKYWEKHQVGEVKELNYDDFRFGDPSFFNERKMRIYRKRFNDETYHAFGIFDKNMLIYSCWISLKYLDVTNSSVQCEISNNESLKIDAYCHPKYRGKGIHGSMNAFRILKASEYGKNTSVVLVYWLNRPAIKSQIKIGYSVSFTFYVVNVWGKVYTNFFKHRNKCA